MHPVFDESMRVLVRFALTIIFIIILVILTLHPRVKKKIDVGESAKQIIKDTFHLVLKEEEKLKLEKPAQPKQVREVRELYQDGALVGILDKPYDLSKKIFTISEIQIVSKIKKGEPLELGQHKIRILQIKQHIGLFISLDGLKGPLFREVECEIIE